MILGTAHRRPAGLIHRRRAMTLIYAPMTSAHTHRNRVKALSAFAALCALAIAIGVAASADAVTPRVLGKTKSTPGPSCPTPRGDPPARKECQAMGEVTGFQKVANGKQGLFRVPKAGKIVAFSVDLAKPRKSERDFFRTELGDRCCGGDPTVRLALLSHAAGKKFRLRAQSPRVKVGGDLNSRPIFTLNRPLKVEKGWIIGLTTKTWLPNFAHDLKRSGNVWRASRRSNRCEGFNNLTKNSRPHTNKGTVRNYGCTYKRARLLYWAYFVAN
jgi:hypothetical protein